MISIRALGVVTAVTIAALAPPLSAQDGASARGEVVKVDLHGGMITIKHGPIQNLGLGAATDDFKPSDAIMFNALRPGDAVTFTAARANGQLVISAIVPPP